VLAVAATSGTPLEAKYTCARPPDPSIERTRVARAEHYRRQIPGIDTDAPRLVRAFERSISDLVSLRTKGEDASTGEYFIAAGIPWFMALFGRDTLTCYQAIAFCPDLAAGSLRALSRLQG